MPFSISPDLYNEFKDRVLALTNARQRYEPEKRLRGLTDAEIAERLGITPADATEIRCIAEVDLADAARYFEADGWKEGRRAQNSRPAGE